MTVAELGKADVLVNNAGIGTAVPATRETPEQFRKVIDVNLNGSYWMAQAFARAIGEDGGSIVNIGSVLGSTTAGLPQAAYGASKAAIIGLTRDLAQQWTGRKKIRVNALAPGFFPSEMTDQYPDGYLDAMMVRVPAGRGGDPAELTAALLFLASDASSYVTGVAAAGRRRDARPDASAAGSGGASAPGPAAASARAGAARAGPSASAARRARA